MKIQKHNNRGYTLLETLMYVAVTTGILLIVVSTFVVLTVSKERNRVYTEVDYQGIKVMNIITQEIRSARSINSPTAGVSSSILSLQSFISTEDPTVFEIVDGTLYMTKGIQDAIQMTNDNVEVTQFNVLNASGAGTPGNIKLYITLKNLTGISLTDNLYSQTYEGSASLR